MADKQPVIIELSTSNKKEKQEKKSYIKDSATQMINIAQAFGLDATLQPSSPLSDKTLLERAIWRDRKQREQQQNNLENVMQLAHSSCSDEAAGEPDPDWLHRFFNMAQDIYNPSMQRLWAQVLKKEVTNPGSTSMKALNTLKEMSPKEAQNLQRAASLACSFGSDHSRKLLLGFKTANGLFSFTKRDTDSTINLGQFKLPYSSLLLLVELGIILRTELESGDIELEPALPLIYQGKTLTIKPHNKGIKLIYYRFSPTGNELCNLLGNKPNSAYYDQLTTLLAQKFTLQTEIKSTVDHIA
ncbi:TIGR03899 family protein [Vibrio sp. 10N.286.49.B3]|uniref:TIGR03899 family protein n=1 Tax=Vibrio sp. 10N.286.49.B3 TaxID=1880855 RepID=UPI000C818CC7|nr:TIGR03899 family protein [Vibrio sp. 10N.286.49.B3]PMH42557.1 TIGR03899 family protein [Vibrio sp. 10N.286.49.B3]